MTDRHECHELAQMHREIFEKALEQICERRIDEMVEEFQKRFPKRTLEFCPINGDVVITVDGVYLSVSWKGSTIADHDGRWSGVHMIGCEPTINCLHFIRDAVNDLQEITDEWRLCAVAERKVVPE